MNTVTIGKNFFKKSLNDYSNWKYCWVREILQNSIDAKSTKILFEKESNKISVSNNGDAMDESTLIGKFMNLGESGKDFNNSVGGFGRAKEILCFAHEKYQIETGDLLVSGSGGDYKITKGATFAGTKTSVWFDDEVNIKYELDKICQHLTYSGEIYYNDELIEKRLEDSRPIGSYSWGDVKVIPGSYRMVVRIGGLPMFDKFILSENHSFLVDLKGASSETLTSNRDGLKSSAQKDLDALIQKLAFEDDSNFETDKPYWIIYGEANSKVESQEDAPELPEYTIEEVEAQEAIFSSQIKEERAAAKSLPNEDYGAVAGTFGISAERR